jgi:DNA-binding PadR family transcriptional regulator
MEAEGLLRSGSEVVDGRARRSYVATAKGRRVLKDTIVQVRELANEVLGEEAP